MEAKIKTATKMVLLFHHLYLNKFAVRKLSGFGLLPQLHFSFEIRNLMNPWETQYFSQETGNDIWEAIL